MIGFIDAAMSRSRTTLMMMGVIILCGLISRAVLPIDNEPAIVLPYFYIGIAHEGISPGDAERLLIQPMEIELRKIEGIEEIRSTASEGFGTLLVEFEPEVEMDKALMDVREAVDRGKSEIPSTAEEPFVNELNFQGMPVIQVNLLSDGASERQIFNVATQLRDELETIPTVLDVELRGQREEVLEVLIDPQALDAYQISSESLASTLSRNNRLIPAGSIESGGGRFSVKVPSVVETASDVMDLPVKVSGDAVITLGDVATIRRTFKDRTTFARYNGEATMFLEVNKRADANIIDTANAVLAMVEEAQTRVPASIRIVPSGNAAEFAEGQVTELQGNIITALALVMVVVVAAMGFRSGVIVGMGIPVSLLFSIIIIYQLGYTFNFMVMFGMLLGLGMLIDGAIVVTEYADRKMSEGVEHHEAYSEAVKRMFWPVTASTATTLAAFLPLMFWPGIPGQFMRYLPVTVFTVLSGSLLYALLFGPVLGSIFGKPTAHSEASQANLETLDHGDPTTLGGATGAYARLMTAVTAHPVTTIGFIFSLLVGVFWAYGEYGRGMIFFNDTDPQFMTVSVGARGNYTADEVNALVLDVEQRVLETPGIRSVNTRTALPGGSDNDQIGFMFVELLPESQRDFSGFDVVDQLRDSTNSIPGLRVEVQPMDQGPGQGKPIQIELRSRYRDLLEPAMVRIREYMESRPELIDIEDSRSLPSIEWRMEVDRAQAALYQADVVSAGVALQLVTAGVKVADYRPDGADDAVDIRARFPMEARGLRAMEELRIATTEGQVPLSNFVRITPESGVDSFERINGIPVEQIRSNVVQGVLPDTMVRDIEAWIDDQDWDPRLDIQFRGANEDQADSMAFVSVAFLLSLLLMFILLVTQFNSFYQSGLILLAVVMSTAGVLLGLLFTASPFSAVLTGVGVVSLAGIVVNNNIVLIDTFNYIRQAHPELKMADIVVRASAQRLRPVMLTTVTTVFGLLPLACDLSIDLVNRSITAGGQMATFWGPLSQAIVFGLSFATILTLIATPAFLVLPSHVRREMRKRMGKRGSATPPEAISQA